MMRLTRRIERLPKPMTAEDAVPPMMLRHLHFA